MTATGETVGWFRLRHGLLVITAVLVTLFSGAVGGTLGAPLHAAPAGMPSVAAPAAALHSPAPLVPHPLANNPVISYYYFSPSSLVETLGSTTIYSYVYGGSGTFTLTYTGLPAGCASQNSTSFSCTPAANGTFVVELTAVDTYGNTSYANATLDVYPWAVEPFYGLSQAFAVVPHAEQPCTVINASPFFTAYCYQQQQSPSLLTFPNGTTAVSYSATTTTSSTTCAGSAASTVSRVEVALSTDRGVAFGAPIDIGSTTCAYLDAIEPSFAASARGVGYGVFVEENSSATPGHYVARAGDALGFVMSTNNGSTWSTAQTIVSGGNIARPAIATVGSTIYVVFEDIANSSTPLPGGGLPISLHFISSSNGGSTWSAVRTLPGMNASQGYNAMSPSVAIAPNGTVAVAYATNRSCANPAPAGACYTWGDSVVVATSATNGSSWSGIHAVAKGVGESSCVLGPCLNALFESTPQTSVAYGANGNLYVGYSGTFSQAGATSAAKNYRYDGAFAASSTNGGVGWTLQTLGAAEFGHPLNYTNVAVGAHAGKLFATFSLLNGTYGTSVFAMSYTQWVAGGSTTGALALSPPVMVSLDKVPTGQNTNATANSFVGFQSAIGFDTVGSSMLAFSLPQPASFSTASSTTYFYANYTYPTLFSVGYVPTATTTGVAQVIFQVTGLPAGTQWSFTLQGQTVATNATEIDLFNVPTGIPMPFTLGPGATSGYGILQSGPPTSTISSPVTFYGSTTVTISYHTLFAYNVSWVPYWPPNTGYYNEWYHYTSVFTCSSSCFDAYTYSYREVDAIGGTLGNYLFNYSYMYWYDYGTGDYRQAYSDWYGYTGTGSFYYNNYSYGRPNPGNGHAFPLYLPADSSFYSTWADFGDPGAPLSVAVGTGDGSYTGSLNPVFVYPPYDYEYQPYNAIVMHGPVNETIYAGGATSSTAKFNESVIPYGLPTGTPYHFEWNGTNYSGVSPTGVSVLNQLAGGYAVTDVSANGSTPGWEYFGNVNPPGDVIVPFQPNVNLSFTSYEDLGASPQAVAFHALNIASGTTWSLVFNGTTFTSTTPWINMTIHQGVYFAMAEPAVSSDGASTYAASGFGPTVTIGSSTTHVDITYGPTYRVQVNAATGGTVSMGSGNPVTSLTVWAAPGAQYTFHAAATPGWSFVTWTGTGAGSYTGTLLNATVTADGTITESASFEPLPGARFNLTFVEAGLPAGTWWTVTLDGTGYSTSTNTMTIPNLYAWSAAGNLGKYTLTVPYAYSNGTISSRFAAQGYAPLVGTNGTATPPITLAFGPQQLVTVASGAGGSAQLVVGGIPVGGTYWATSGQSIVLQEQAGPGYTFAGWTGSGDGSYTGLLLSPQVTVGGTPITEYAGFSKILPPVPSKYSLTVTQSSALAPGTVWGITVRSGTGLLWNASATGSSVNVTGLLAGSYSFSVHMAVSPDGQARYLSQSTNPTSVTVTANKTVTISYLTQYWVTIEGSNGGLAGPASGWVTSAGAVSLQAVPADGYQFLGWVGTGAGSYTGTNATEQFFVTGPVTEVAEFVPIVQTHSQSTTTIWQNTGVLAGLAAAGIVVGLIVGLLVFRGRKGAGGTEMRPVEAPAPMEAAAPTPEYMEDAPPGGGA
jgi:Divergent InlB B-repeat domain